MLYNRNMFPSNRKKLVFERYSLSLGKARVCRSVGVAFLLIAALWGLAAASQVVLPGWSFVCSDEHGCRQTSNLASLLPEKEQDMVLSDPDAQTRFAAYVARPPVHIGLAALTLVDEGFLVFLFVAVGLTLHRLGERGENVLGRALPWLKRAALAAFFWAVAQPLTDSLRTMLLYPGTPSGASWFIGIDLTVAGPALLLAIAAYAIAWALEAGVRAERDLANFV